MGRGCISTEEREGRRFARPLRHRRPPPRRFPYPGVASRDRMRGRVWRRRCRDTGCMSRV